MTEEIDRQIVETCAGTYTVVWYYDELASQPEDDGFALIANVNGYRDSIDIDTAPAARVADEVRRVVKMNASIGYGDYWPSDYRSGAALVRYLTLKGLKGVTLVDSNYRPLEPSSDRCARFDGVAWDQGGSDDQAACLASVRNNLAEWRAWADGDVFGWQVIGPDGQPLEAIIGGYYCFLDQRDDSLSEARELIEWDAEQRANQANLVGAGIVGLI